MPSRQEWASIFVNGWAHSCAAADSRYVFLVSDRLLPGDPLSAYGHFPRRGKQGLPMASAPTAGTAGSFGAMLPRPPRRWPPLQGEMSPPLAAVTEGYVPPTAGEDVSAADR